MDQSQRSLVNLVLMAHAEIRALREAVETMLIPNTSIGIEQFQAIEADCRRKHLENLHLDMPDLQPLLAEAEIAEATQGGRDSAKSA